MVRGWIVLFVTYGRIASHRIASRRVASRRIASRRLKIVRLHRPAGALVGAVLAVAAGAVTPDEAARAADHTTIVLLFAVMGMDAFLSIDGFFERAMASTFAGDLTLLGSVANVIVAQKAEPVGGLRFGEYLRAGVSIAVSTTLAGAGILVLLR